jgi:hypothetical protein
MLRWSIVVISVLCLLMGCDLLSTREAEEPELTTDLCEPATSPDQVTDVLGCALQFHLPEDYLETFDQEAYDFTPDGAALSNHQDLIPWGYQEEETHIRRLLSEQVVPADSMVWVEFTEEEAVEWGDSARYLENYLLYIGHILEGVPRQVQGRAELTLGRTNYGTWVIQRWRDEAIGEVATWSDIRALIR